MGDFIKKILTIKVRRANEKDVNDWAEILHQSSEEIYSQYVSRDYINNNYNEKRLKENFLQEINQSDSNSELYMLMLNDIPAGILKIGKPIKYYTDGKNYYRDDIEGIGEIKSLHIKKQYQGHGIGSQAICFAEDRLKELNYKKSSIWVKMQNVKAIDFYISRGYQKTDFINPNTNDKAPSIVMEKQLRIKEKEDKAQENVKLVLVDSDEETLEYELKSKSGEKISSYTVERNKEKALISYETSIAFRNKGYASMGLNLLKKELFKENNIFILELINLSGDYSRKVAENAGFFSPYNSIDYFVALHPFAEDIIERNMQQLESETSRYDKQEKLLQRMRSLRKKQSKANTRLVSKLAYLKTQVELEDNENYKIDLQNEINHIERILNNSPQKNNENIER